ncbi:MAG TPA: histidine kinase [Gemmatimonadaceae bacterium]
MSDHPGDGAGSAAELLERYRSEAERLLNGVRALVLLLLATAAVAYGRTLPVALTLVNVCVLVPTLAWTVAQWLWFRRRETLPGWLAVMNPVVDITAITAIMGGYGLAYSPELAFRSPIFLAYFAVLASRPITSSARMAGAAVLLAVAEYGALLAVFAVGGRAGLVYNPLAVVTGPGVSVLDECAKLLLLAVAGGIAAYATRWHERLVTSHFRQTRHRERLEARLARAQLQSLKLQLHPHFLFNTLNTITALLATDPHAAERVVTGLSELLRVSLRTAGEQEVPLDRELVVLRHYTDIQQVRFPDRLRIELSIAPETRRAMVPSLLLQPLVENAIRHGIAPRAASGCVEISARREGDRLLLRVRDDGVGAPGAGVREGVGLRNTRERLRHLYGDAHELRAGNGELGGFDVRIVIPFRDALAPGATTPAASLAGVS